MTSKDRRAHFEIVKSVHSANVQTLREVTIKRRVKFLFIFTRFVEKKILVQS